MKALVPNSWTEREFDKHGQKSDLGYLCFRRDLTLDPICLLFHAKLYLRIDTRRQRSLDFATHVYLTFLLSL
jgi:hypothetical protein